jgi:hypothetical protein
MRHLFYVDPEVEITPDHTLPLSGNQDFFPVLGQFLYVFSVTRIRHA